MLNSVGKKVHCAVYGALYQPWLDITRDGQEKTWISGDLPKNLTVTHYHGIPIPKYLRIVDNLRSKFRFTNRWVDYFLRFFEYILFFPFLTIVPEARISKRVDFRFDSIQINFPDFFNTTRTKILGIMKHFLNETSDDFLLITTSSSYIVTSRLMEFVEALSDSVAIVGSKPYESATFLSGSNILFSRNLVEKIIKNRIKWDPTLLNDLGLGKLLKKLQVEMKSIPLKNISSLEGLQNISDIELKDFYHFRLKSQQRLGSDKLRNDVAIFHALHKRITEQK